MPPLLRQFALFVSLNLADFLLTWCLLERCPTGAYESNPLARWCLFEYGWTGLAAFKAALVVVVGASALVVFRVRRRAAERLMTFGCATLAAVVLYSSSLLALGPEVSAASAEDESLAGQPAEWVEEARRNVAHEKLLAGLCDDLIAGRRTLDRAVDVLADSDKARNTRWLHRLTVSYDCADVRKCLAAYLLAHAEGYCRDVCPTQLSEIAPRLRAAFHAEHGSLPPSIVNLLLPLGEERADPGQGGGRGDRPWFLIAFPPAQN